MKKKIQKIKPVIGWREWVGLPAFGIKAIKVKVDTGARSSSIHVNEMHEYEKNGKTWVKFKVHPVQRKKVQTVEVDIEVLEHRAVRSSSGRASIRPVVITDINLLEETWPVELTLASRDKMGFRMLLGREAFRGRFLVDAGRSFYNGKPKRKKKSSTKRLSIQKGNNT